MRAEVSYCSRDVGTTFDVGVGVPPPPIPQIPIIRRSNEERRLTLEGIENSPENILPADRLDGASHRATELE